MDDKKKLFDIDSEDVFFDIITNSFTKYKNEKTKSVELLLFIIMGLNHLSEWIAPGYKPYTYSKKENKPITEQQKFSKAVYDTGEHKIIRKICNKSKHITPSVNNTSSSHELSFDEWPDVDEVRDFDNGPVTSYKVDDRDITEIIEKLILFYQTEWFNDRNK
jgi:hypothetical protein